VSIRGDEPKYDEATGAGADERAVRVALAHAAHLLPAQGPIAVFIHHNTLHGFEDLRFTEAVEQAAERFGCEPYLSEKQYRAELFRGRIRQIDLDEALRAELNSRADEPVVLGMSLGRMYATALQYPYPTGTPAELEWWLSESDGLRKVRPGVSEVARARLIAETRRWAMRELRGQPAATEPLAARLAGAVERWDDAAWEQFALEALWGECRSGPRRIARPASPHRRLRAGERSAADRRRQADLLVNELLIPLTAAFLDQGIAHWPLPDREDGFFACFLKTCGDESRGPQRWRRRLRSTLRRVQEAGIGAEQSVVESLRAMGVPRSEWGEFITERLLALRGWAGMVREIALRSDRVVRPIPTDSLMEFLAVRLLCDRCAAEQLAADDAEDPADGDHEETTDRTTARVTQQAVSAFVIAQVNGWTAAELRSLTENDWGRWMSAIDGFGTVERRRILHAAFERRFSALTLDALALHQPGPVPARPRFQAVFCLDEREESFRRHVEEIAPDAVTYGAAGFFGVPIYFRGADDAHFTPLCPIVIRPRHWLTEEVADGASESLRMRSVARRWFGAASHRLHVGSRGVAAGALLSAGLGVFATAPLVARTMFPRLTARFRRFFSRAVPHPPTRLRLERSAAEPGPEPERNGFTAAEMSDFAERLLRDIGLTDGFARVVLFIGHGSGSQNNPHKSAYDCGACGGSPGGPNSRTIARMLNDPRVRDALAGRGIVIGPETWFLGGLHHTCSDAVTLFDVDVAPQSHAADIARIRLEFDEASDRNAHERCRRFHSAPLRLTPRAARLHVEGRSEDLAQTRPELGHATNAICVVGRRSRTRGLFLDRRAFLASYDPTQDSADGATLFRLLSAIVPVCGGINLEYFFSRIDNAGYGCGSKLPHNITGLVGVMDGAASDLRTGLPWQMVEIHEPVRLSFVVETRPETMLQVMARSRAIDRFFRNEWAHLALLDPDRSALLRFTDGRFEPHVPQAARLPRATSSADWYRGWREHLEFATIRSEA
jgi:uncharacterized protein YbcC (UPF0753/DUF2309 family)